MRYRMEEHYGSGSVPDHPTWQRGVYGIAKSRRAMRKRAKAALANPLLDKLVIERKDVA